MDSKTSNISIWAIMIGVWAIVMVGIGSYYFYSKNKQNKFWRHYSGAKNEVIYISGKGFDAGKIGISEVALINSVLSKIPNVQADNLQIIKDSDASSEIAAKKYSVFFGDWNAAMRLYPTIPLQFLNTENNFKGIYWKSRELNKKVSLPFINDDEALTYACVCQISTSLDTKALLFLGFESLDFNLFLHFFTNNANIQSMYQLLDIQNSDSDFIALFKAPKVYSKDKSITLLDGHSIKD